MQIKTLQIYQTPFYSKTRVNQSGAQLPLVTNDITAVCRVTMATTDPTPRSWSYWDEHDGNLKSRFIIHSAWFTYWKCLILKAEQPDKAHKSLSASKWNVKDHKKCFVGSSLPKIAVKEKSYCQKFKITESNTWFFAPLQHQSISSEQWITLTPQNPAGINVQSSKLWHILRNNRTLFGTKKRTWNVFSSHDLPTSY